QDADGTKKQRPMRIVTGKEIEPMGQPEAIGVFHKKQRKELSIVVFKRKVDKKS
ncbi:hypothetical protein K7432_016480, partial [Basidiobolus ranarum]